MHPAIAIALLGSVAQINPFTSFRKLTSSNGFAPVVYDQDARRINSFRENLYRYPAPGQQTHELAYDSYLGLRVAGMSGWLTDTAPSQAAYEIGTNLIRTVQEARGVRVTTYYFAPFPLQARAFIVVAILENIGPDTTDVALFSIHNFHTGGGQNQVTAEHITWDPTLGAYLESSALADAPQGVLLAKPITQAAHHTATPMNPYPLVQMSALFGDVADSGVLDDAVSGFEFDVNQRGTFHHGETAEIALAICWAPDRDAGALAAAIDAYTAGRTPSAIVGGEKRAWDDWHSRGLWPDGTSPAEDRLARQALAVLRMGQVREAGAPNGAIVASIPPGYWDIAWLRDSMIAVEAFERTGHRPEAQAALDFAMRGPVGAYQSYVGQPYGLSVARYFGNGAEDSDSNADGPNVELDGFGMYLGAAALHASSSTGGAAWFSAHRSAVDSLIAGVLVSFRDPATGLVAGDSSIWETHWMNGGRQRWCYTSGMAVDGLLRWSRAIEHLAGPQDPAISGFRAAAAEIRHGMLVSLVDPTTRALAASVEQLAAGDGLFADAQAAMVLNTGAFSATSAIGLGTLDFLKSKLFLTTTGHGYKRNDDGGPYDNREWIVIDLALSRALRTAGRTQEADALLGWVTAEGDLNNDILPELLNETDASYLGAIPMVGFGAGAYLLALIARSGTRPGMPAIDASVPDALPSDGALSEAGSSDAPVSLDQGSEGSADGGAAGDSGAALDGAGAAAADAQSASGGRQSGCGCSGVKRRAVGRPGLEIGIFLGLWGILLRSPRRIMGGTNRSGGSAQDQITGCR